MFAVIFSAVYAKRTEVALGICSILFVLMPTYFVHNFEIPFNNWLLGSVSPMSASKGEVLSALTLTLILTLTLTLTLTLPLTQTLTPTLTLAQVLSAVWSSSPNTSRFDELLGLPALGLRLGLGPGLGLGSAFPRSASG